MKTGAAFKRGASRQDYATPREFLNAVKARWGFDKFDFDAAADRENRIAEEYFGLDGCFEHDALAESWTWSGRNAWLNPPFDTIRPWAEKCRNWIQERKPEPSWYRGPHQRLFFLVPASVGSEWWAEFVDKHAAVKFLRPRLSFDGKNPYPKDCALAVYGETPGYECWRWK